MLRRNHCGLCPFGHHRFPRNNRECAIKSKRTFTGCPKHTCC